MPAYPQLSSLLKQRCPARSRRCTDGRPGPACVWVTFGGGSSFFTAPNGFAPRFCSTRSFLPSEHLQR